jgi:hypothetical protein
MSCTCPFHGMLYEPLVTWPVRHLEGYVVAHRSIREQRLDTNPSIPRRQPQLPCDSHCLRLRPSNIPDLMFTLTLTSAERGQLGASPGQPQARYSAGAPRASNGAPAVPTSNLGFGADRATYGAAVAVIMMPPSSAQWGMRAAGKWATGPARQLRD